ncbi:MAG: c-type cytochrome biogenesis protein CcmI [Hyphomicrobiaceae bacterium]
MLLWVVFAVMSAGVVVGLLHPLLTRRARETADQSAATAVYRDQLAEIDAEARRGLIGPDEAEAARREISRRILASVPAIEDHSYGPQRAEGTNALAHQRRRTSVAAATALLLPVASLAVYLQIGSPGTPTQPIASRRSAPPANAEMAKLVTAVEERLKSHPDDSRGWDVIAPVYLRLGRHADAAFAYARALHLSGDSSRRLAGLAEAAMLRDNGRVGDEAKSALNRLLKLEPGHVQARFWLAFAKEQEGDLAAAATDYSNLIADAPPDAEWRPMLEERIAAVRTALRSDGRAPRSSAPPPVPGVASSAAQGSTQSARPSPSASTEGGPTSADISAAARLSPADRQAMIDGMVSGLAARLEKDGRDLEGWRKLIRALAVLGRKDEAVAALGRARKSLADEPQALASLADLATSLGLGT